MRSTFGGLSIASSALAAQRQALDTAGQNIANVNTPGYSRQRVDLAAKASHAAGMHTGTAVFGNGVTIVAQTRIVDQFLDQRVMAERSALGYAGAVADVYGQLELAFNEPGENGLAAQLEGFWDAWDTLASTPEDSAARASLLQRAGAIADTFTQITSQFDTMVDNSLQQAKAMVTSANTLATQIANLNDKITGSVNLGSPANELMDQRDELARQLSTMVDITTRLDDTGAMSISIGGTQMVSGKTAHTLGLDATTPGAVALTMSNSSRNVSAGGGELAGTLQAVNTTIPAYQAKIDALAVDLATMVNAQHQMGKDLNEVAGGAFFVATSARDLAVNPAIIADPGLVAASGAGEGRFGAANALAMADLSDAAGGPGESYRAMIAGLGVEALNANRREDAQALITEQVEAQRDEVSGVSLDEEMTNMVAYQQAYQAAARFLTTIDEMLNTLINSTGMVGR